MGKKEEIQKIVSDIRKHYELSVKILIDKEFYEVASDELADINLIDIQPNINDIKMYRSGGMFLASSAMLEEKLKTKNEGIGEATELFEAYLDELELSIESGDRFDNRIS